MANIIYVKECSVKRNLSEKIPQKGEFLCDLYLSRN